MGGVPEAPRPGIVQIRHLNDTPPSPALGTASVPFRPLEGQRGVARAGIGDLHGRAPQNPRDDGDDELDNHVCLREIGLICSTTIDIGPYGLHVSEILLI